MDSVMKKNKIPVFIFYILLMTFPQLCFSTILPVLPETEERLEILIREHEKIYQELQQIQSRLDRDYNSITEEEYLKVTRLLFKLMDDLTEKKKAIQEFRKELDDLFTEPPVLKLVRITGPTPGVQGSPGNSLGYPEEIEYKPNGSGYTLRVKDMNGRLYSSAGVAVTYAPLEIRPGESFHFEVEARQSVFHYKQQDCSRQTPRRMGVQIDPDNNFGSPTKSLSKADLNCQSGSVTLSMRFKPEPPVFSANSDYWIFPYDMEAVTSGSPVQGHPFKAEDKEIYNFRLPEKKSEVDLHYRDSYKLDVTVEPKIDGNPYGNAPKLVLHYRAQDESIAFLPEYRFPEDVNYRITVPDLKGMSRQEAVDKLSTQGLDSTFSIGTRPPESGLSNTVASQNPAAGETVNFHSNVEIILYSDFKPASIALPDFSGKTVKEVKVWFNEKGLKVRFSASSPAPSDALSFKIKETDPGSGIEVSSESEVTALVYGKYKPEKITIPDLTGMAIETAKKRLNEKGLKVKLDVAGPAPSDSLSFKVKETTPAAGTGISSATEVIIRVYGKYLPTREEQVARLNCSRYPGTSAYWNESKGKAECQCPSGTSWSSDENRCVKRLTPDQSCARSYPNSVFIKKNSQGGNVCGCPSGYAWNSNKTRCNKLTPDQSCARSYPNSVFIKKNSQGGNVCGCPSGYAWNSNKTRCVKLTPDQTCARSYPGSVYGNRKDAQGRIICDCPSGYAWNSNKTQCVKQAVKRPDNISQNNQQNACSGELNFIRSLVGIASASSKESPVFKSQIESAANQARRSGCNEAEIQKAMGKYGTAGSGSGNNRSSGSGGSGGTWSGGGGECTYYCPSGGELIDERGVFGQGDVYCVYSDGRKEYAPCK